MQAITRFYIRKARPRAFLYNERDHHAIILISCDGLTYKMPWE